jgi:pyruvate/2-oxoglutarate dehydrogenase complex dihydrolipoamide acyltransferase (E2) component
MTKTTYTKASLIALTAAGLLCLPAAYAQTATAKKPAPKATAKPATKSAARPSSAKAAAPVAAAAAVTALSSEQLSIAQIVTTGRIQCADGQSVTITPDARVNGAFDLQFGSAKYDVTPKPTSSGAVRLEDPRSGIVFMQLANKSMLFNEKQSRRLADDCISPAQQAVANQMRANPTPGVLDSPTK